MPTYDYVCQKCHHEWSMMRTIHEHEKAPKPACPKCRSRQVQQKISAFVAVTPRKA